MFTQLYTTVYLKNVGSQILVDCVRQFPTITNTAKCKKKKCDNTLTVKLGTINQLLFATSLFCDLSEIKWFAATNFRNQDVDYLETYIPDAGDDWFVARNICDDKVLMNLAKISSTRI